TRQVDEALREHGTIKDDVRALRDADPADETVDARVTKLQECVERHVEEEEGQMFPRLDEVMTDDDRAARGQRVQERQRARMSGGTERRAAGGRRTRGRRSRAARSASTRAKARTTSRSKKARGKRSRKTSGQKRRAR